MKKQAAILLISIVVAWAICPSIGYLGQLWSHLERVHILLKNEKPTHEFLLTPENAADFRWIDAHEFWHDGQLFDVQKRETRGDSTRLFARADAIETGLQANFAEFFFHKNNSDAPQNQFWKMWQMHPFLVPMADVEPFLSCFLVNKRLFTKKERWASRAECLIFLPPRG